LVRRTLGSDSPIVLVPYDTAYGHGFDDLRHRQPDLTKLRQAIDFEPTIALEQTIRDLATVIASNAMPGATRTSRAVS
jgi:UDP-glucose 4-epimerase